VQINSDKLTRFKSIHVESKIGCRFDNYVYVVAGNLALSRALGDFVFKKNNMKLPEEQIVTGSLCYSVIVCRKFTAIVSCNLERLVSEMTCHVSGGPLNSCI